MKISIFYDGICVYNLTAKGDAVNKETNLPKKIRALNKEGTILTDFHIRKHKIKCDEEPLYGGRDSAPDPYDFILAGVGGCTAISLRQFAERKGWEIGEIDISLTYDSVDGEDVITKDISFSGEVSDAQRKVLLRVANCNTEKMLAKEIKFTNTIR